MSDDATIQTGKLPPLERNRSLVFAERRGRPRSLPLVAADFLAQLIASDRHLGDHRRALRRDPASALGEYRPHRAPRATTLALDV